jgi:hypothetical protein
MGFSNLDNLIVRNIKLTVRKLKKKQNEIVGYACNKRIQTTS